MPTDAASPAGTPASGPHAEPLRPVSAAELAAAPFPYLRWAKASLTWDPLGLGMSGLAPVSAAERADLGLAVPPEVGDPAGLLKKALAERYGLAPDNVHPAAGTSHANFITYLALARGGRVAVESPAYEALQRLPDAVGASLSTFRRDPARGWRIDARSLDDAVAAGPRLLVASDLHNPSGARLHDEDLGLLVEAGARCGAYVLIDEVYADFDPQERPTAAHRDPRVLVTNSLTKVHGLPDLRAGWILGAPDVVARIEAWDDLVHPALPPAPMVEAAVFLPQAQGRLGALRARAAERAAQVDAWVRATAGVSWVRPAGGLTGFLDLGGRNGDAVAERAWSSYGVRVVPGSFFQVPGALRISFLLAEQDLARALEGLGRALVATA